MQMTTSKIDEICLRYTDNEKVSSLPPPVKEPWFSHHGIKNRRRKMEDRLVCLPRFHALYNIPCNSEASYYGLFDGHNGTCASSFAVAHLHQFLAESPHYPNDPVKAFFDAYQKTESHFIAKEVKGGSTALAVLHQIEEKKIVVSWLGDSQAILVKQEGYLLLADPHKPGRKDEFERIETQGGYVLKAGGSYRVNGQLSVSRAIGDKEYKPYVSSEPDVRVIDLTGSEEFFVIGCDGLWDVVQPEDVIEAVYSQMKENPGESDNYIILYLRDEKN
ncbi:UNVERIFIED_CONTAM: hypothetical protein PYX00_005319 [Menopon gallinae]|uniref:PPM-type phosphatase domain-containing protein n=1 Tax=Menopon gallinae TaxID=328185 RepID=A0AAW2HQU0_9NEOP